MNKGDDRSLSEINSSIEVVTKKGFWKKLFSFMGPAYLVSVGYMDPGNWATDLAGGSQFGYKLIWVLLMSNLMALLLQSLSARLGLVQKLDLAQASRANYPRFVNFCLWILAEIAIAATDLAEVLGMAIGLQLLFGIPLLWGVSLTVADTFLFLLLQNYGVRKMEAFIICLIAIIGGSFLVEMILAKPDMSELAAGFIPSIPNSTALYIAIGIIGATIMPHNLYLHSALVQTRRFDSDEKSVKSAIKFNIIDSAIALNLAFFVNAAILVLAASTFFNNGMFEVAEIQDAHKFLEPLLGSKWAPILFAVALIAAGQSSTITGTLAGQIVMEGYLNLRIQPWLRRLITRLIAIIPALLVILISGESKTGELLIFSQVILSLQLGFAIIPLIHFVSNREKMGVFAIGKLTKFTAWLIALIIVSLNVNLVFNELLGWLESAGDEAYVLWLTVVPVMIAAVFLLLYLVFNPLFRKHKKEKLISPHGLLQPLVINTDIKFRRIAIALDFSDTDAKAVNGALAQGGKNSKYVLIHIVESVSAYIMGGETSDHESSSDLKYLEDYTAQLNALGYDVGYKLEFGSPKKKIPQIVKDFDADLLVMAAHGHQWFKDILFGTTVDSVRHKIDIQRLVVK
ncbi:MAG: Nramp family divalent metal transporter [Saprospiraceae bacterium]|nr:Nramp family divalent metal transporter [Candidatus Brachybacter algidus]